MRLDHNPARLHKLANALTLDNLKPLRVARSIMRPTLAATTGIDPERLRNLELRAAEPWFDECVLLSRALCLDGILPLVGADTIASLRLPVDLPDGFSLAMWKSGRRFPLTAAIDLARRFGLADPETLYTTPLQRQLWAVMQSTERLGDAGGTCPWCAAAVTTGEDHLPTCLPHNLYAVRGSDPHATDHTRELRPEDSRHRYRTRGQKAYGLKRLRETTVPYRRQKDLATVLKVAESYYARLERAEVNLTLEHAATLCRFYNCTSEDIYSAHPSTLDNPTATDKPISLDDHREYIQALEAATQQTK